jgi:hypothetical protein
MKPFFVFTHNPFGLVVLYDRRSYSTSGREPSGIFGAFREAITFPDVSALNAISLFEMIG